MSERYLALPEPVIEGQVLRREEKVVVPCLGVGCVFLALPAATAALWIAEQNNFRLSDYINAPCAVGVGVIAGVSVAIITFGASIRSRWTDA